MRAAVYTTYGPADVLRVEDRPAPAAAAGEILVRVRATEVTKADCELRALRFPVKWFALPLRLALGWSRPRRPILGNYFSGVVEAVGPAVDRFQSGDEVFGSSQLRLGGYGEYLVVPAHYSLAKKPPNLRFEEASAAVLGGLNALHFLDRAEIAEGERVLINGAGGSIGTFGVQLARARGAHVTAVDAPHKRTLLLGLGANAFIDYTTQDFAAAGETYDVVCDMVAASSMSKCLAVLEPGGRYLTGNPTLGKMIRSLLTSAFTDKSASFAFAKESQQELDELSRLLEAGTLRVPLDRVVPLDDIATAHRLVETEQRCGAVVVSLTPEVPNSRGVRFFWDFHGPSAEGTARHFETHLREFFSKNQLSLEATTAQCEGGHWAVHSDMPDLPHALLRVQGEAVPTAPTIAERVGSALRPRRFEPLT